MHVQCILYMWTVYQDDTVAALFFPFSLTSSTLLIVSPSETVALSLSSPTLFQGT